MVKQMTTREYKCTLCVRILTYCVLLTPNLPELSVSLSFALSEGTAASTRPLGPGGICSRPRARFVALLPPPWTPPWGMARCRKGRSSLT
jgi:hypothetical protein